MTYLNDNILLAILYDDQLSTIYSAEQLSNFTSFWKKHLSSQRTEWTM